jgi:hypothetical protein
VEPGAPDRKRTSPWVYVGCGCGALAILALAGVAVMAWLAYRETQNLAKSWSDPKEAAARTRAVLGYDKLPEGYYPMVTFSLPFVMDMAMIGDTPPAPGAKPEGSYPFTFTFKERGFMYTKMRRWGRSRREHSGNLPEWPQGDTKIETEEVIGRGEVDANGQRVSYTAFRGEVSQGGHSHPGITTMIQIDCPQDERERFGMWYGPDPKPGETATPADFTGTNADPEEIRKFVSHFRFCPEGK